MRLLEAPGTLVKFTLGNLAMTGRIVYANGKTAEVRANGATYEVDKAALKILPMCQRAECGKPIARASRKYCSLECSRIARIKNRCETCGKHVGKRNRRQCQQCKDAAYRANTDNLVFSAIVKFQRANVGATPPKEYLAENAFVSKETAQEALLRLEKAGRIRRLGGCSPARSIIVIGAKWTFEEAGGSNGGDS